MAGVMKWGGLIWALIGVANLIGMFAKQPSSGLATFGLLFNVVLFCFPGLVLYALGARMGKPTSATARLGELELLKASGKITDEEYTARRGAIISQV